MWPPRQWHRGLCLPTRSAYCNVFLLQGCTLMMLVSSSCSPVHFLSGRVDAISTVDVHVLIGCLNTAMMPVQAVGRKVLLETKQSQASTSGMTYTKGKGPVEVIPVRSSSIHASF